MIHNYCIHLNKSDLNKYPNIIKKGQNRFTIAAFINLWQRENNKTREDFPTEQQLDKYINERNEKLKTNIVMSRKFDIMREAPVEKKNVQGENISSTGSDFGKLLTNLGNNLEIEYKGKKFRNAEHAYQTWKSGEFDEVAYNDNGLEPKGSKRADLTSSYQTMVDILTAKLQQHPELVTGINERGGIEFLNKSWHNVTGDKFWESKGQNKFIEALKDAYKNVTGNTTGNIEIYNGYWTRAEVEKHTDKVFLFGDNTNDRVNTHYVPSSTQAVIRGLPNAIGIDTKKNRGTSQDSYFTDADFDTFKAQVDEAIQKAKDSGKTIVIPADGIGTGKAMLKEKAPKLFKYLQSEIQKLQDDTQSQGTNNTVTNNLDGIILGLYEAGVRAESDNPVDRRSNYAREIRDPQTRIDRENLVVKWILNDIDKIIANAAKKGRYLSYGEAIKKLSGGNVSMLFEKYRDNFLVRHILGRDEYIQTQAQMMVSSGMSEEDALKKAERVYNTIKDAYVQMLNNYTSICENVIVRLLEITGVKINYDTNEAIEFRNNDSTDDSIEDIYADMDDDSRMKEKDHIYNTYNQNSNASTLSARVRRMLNTIPSMIADENGGKLDKDDLMNTRFLPSDYTHAVLINLLRKCVDSSDIIRTLESNTSKYPWIKYVLDELAPKDPSNPQDIHESEMKFTAFAVNMIGATVQYIGEYSSTDGTLHTKYLNQAEDLRYWIDRWENNTNGHMLISNNPDFQIYDENGNYDIQKIKNIQAKLNEARTAYLGKRKTTQPTDEEITISKRNILNENGELSEHANVLFEALKSIGIDVPKSAFINTITDPQNFQVEFDGQNESRKAYEPFIALLNNANTILNQLKKDLQSKSSQDGVNLASLGKGVYYKISRYFISETGDLAEQNIRENGTSRWAHIKDNHIFRLLKKLKDFNADRPVPEGFEGKYSSYREYFINEEFKKYEFFYGPNGWNIDVLNLFENDKWFRDNFNINIVLSQDKKEVSELSDRAMLTSMLAEYNFEKGMKMSDEESSSRTERGFGLARYYLPLPAEAGAGYVATLPRYYYPETTIPRLFLGVFLQEYNRIIDVIHRDRLFRTRALNREEHYQVNFDIARKNDDTIQSYGGAEFKFFSNLNSNKISVYINGDEIVRNPGNEYDKAAILELPEVFVDIYESLNGAKSENLENPDNIIKIIKNSLTEQYYIFKDFAMKEHVLDTNEKGIVTSLNVVSDERSYLENAVKFLNTLYKLRDDAGETAIYGERGEYFSEVEQVFENIGNYLYGDKFKTLSIYSDFHNSTHSGNMIEFIGKLVYGYLKDYIEYNNKSKEPYKIKGNVDYRTVNPNVIYNIISYINNSIYTINDYTESLYSIAENMEFSDVDIALNDFFLNFTYAQTELIQLITGDIAQYNNVKDWIKRAKEYHANGDRLNVDATWHGRRIAASENKKYSRDGYESFVIFNDVKKPSITIDEIKQIVGRHVKNTTEKGFIISAFEQGNLTDAQTFRTLQSYRKISIMHGDWDDNLEAAYNNLINGTWEYDDFWAIYEAIKPYVFTHITDEWTDENGNTHLNKRNIQIKTAESVMLTMYATIAGEGNNSMQFAALNEFLVDNGIDMVTFGSAVKVGGSGFIDMSPIENAKSKQEVFDILYIVLGDYPGMVNYIDLHDMLIQHPVPEHFTDTTQLLGTQIKKLILADTNPETIIKVRGLGDTVKIMGETIDCSNGIKFKDLTRLYQELLTDNMLDAFNNINGQFKDIKDVSEALKRHIRSSATYSQDLLNAVEVITDPETGREVFNIPLHDPVMKNKVEQLLHSMINNNIIQQKIAGGTCTQVSSVAYNSKLHIKFGDGEQVLKTKDEFLKEGKTENDFKKYIANRVKNIEYVECYAPCYNSKLRDYLYSKADPDTGILDPNDIPEEEREEILRTIGYRIPTEDKYSMVPLKIIGFLPANMSSSIMLPSDWITISGSDFDADKLYMMVRELEITDNEVSFDDILEQAGGDMQKAQMLYKNAEKGTSVKTVKYNSLKNSNEQDGGIAARNNMIISIVEGILTSPDCADKILNPGNFELQKRTAVYFNIIENIGYETANELGILDMNPETMSLEELNKIYEQYVEPEHLLNPATWIKNHSRISSSGALIGVFASLSATHPYFQLANISISNENAYVLDGNTNNSFAEVYNNHGRTISKLMSSNVNSSVDDVKYPSLRDCGIDMFTASVSNVMSMKGDEVYIRAALFHQPAVKRMREVFFGNDERAGNKRLAVNTAIEEYQKELMALGFSRESLSRPIDFAASNISFKNLVKNIIDGNSINELTDEEYVEFIKGQYYIAKLYENIFDIANDVAEVNKFFRVDTSSGWGGPNIADTQSLVARLEGFAEKESATITGAQQLVQTDLMTGDAETLRRRILESKIPMAQAAYTLGIESVKYIFGKYLPYFGDAYTNPNNGIIPRLSAMTKTGGISSRLANRVFLESSLYVISGTTDENGMSIFDSFTDAHGVTYKVGQKYEGKILTSADMLSIWIEKMPQMVRDMKKSVESHPFLKRFYVDGGNNASGRKKSVPVVKFRSIGSNAITRSNVESFWFDAMNSSNSIIASYAKQLFIYSGLTNAFNFGPNGWAHHANSLLRKNVDERYIKGLRSMNTGLVLDDDFFDMFVRNHLYEREICPLINKDSFDVMENGVFKESFKVNPNSLFTAAEKQIVKKKLRRGDVLHDYIAFKDNEEGEVYYKLQGDGYTYVKIKPLGAKYRLYVYNRHHGTGTKITVDELANTTGKKVYKLYRRLTPEGNGYYGEKVCEFAPNLKRADILNDPHTLFIGFEKDSRFYETDSGNTVVFLMAPNSNTGSSEVMMRKGMERVMEKLRTGEYWRIALPNTNSLELNDIFRSKLSAESKSMVLGAFTYISNYMEGVQDGSDTTVSEAEKDNESRKEVKEEPSSNTIEQIKDDNKDKLNVKDLAERLNKLANGKAICR